MPVEFDYSDLEKFRADIEKWPEIALTVAQKYMDVPLIFLLGKIPDPPTASSKPVERPDGASFLTEKQRRWFFAAVQAGDIPGWRWVYDTQLTEVFGQSSTYVKTGQTKIGDRVYERRQSKVGHPEKFASARSGDLERRITYDVQRGNGVVSGSIGTNVPYAPWVIGADYPGEDIAGQKMYQARMHEGQGWYQLDKVVIENIDQAWRKFDVEFWPEFFEETMKHEEKEQ